MVSKDRRNGLAGQSVYTLFVSALRELQAEQDIDLYCATLMPDHCHLLYRLGTRLKLDRVQAKLKSRMSDALEAHDLEWQPNFFDHRLRENITAENFVRYVYLNPYAKGLLPTAGSWPFWILNKNHRPEFWEHLDDERSPPKEWLANYRSASQLIDEDMNEQS